VCNGGRRRERLAAAWRMETVAAPWVL
jgi:hypothetical protein